MAKEVNKIEEFNLFDTKAREDIKKLSSQFKDIANLSLTKHTDGKVYIKKQDGTLIGTGVEVGSDADLSKITMSVSGNTLKLLNNGEQIATADLPEGSGEVPDNVVLFEEVQDINETPIPIKSANGTTYYIHVSNEGALTIQNVSGETVWEGGGSSVEGVYFVNNKLTQITTNNNAKNVLEGDSYIATLTPTSGYEISSITIKMGGTDITSSAYTNGNINITNVTGNIIITAIATKIPVKYNITNNLTNATNNNSDTQVNENASYIATISPNQDCVLNDVIVTMGGIDITSTVYSDGQINITSVTGDIVITANAKSTKVTPESLGYTVLYRYDAPYNQDTVLVDSKVNEKGLLDYGYTGQVTVAYYLHTIDGSDVGRFDIFDARNYSFDVRAADGVASNNVIALGGLYKGRNYSDKAVSKIAGYVKGTGSKGKMYLFTNSINGGITEATNENIYVNLLVIQGDAITEEQLVSVFGIE